MKKIVAILFASVFLCLNAQAQAGYTVKFELKNCKDTTLYLARYYFGQSVIIDSCPHIKKGHAVFKLTPPLYKGTYILANQAKQRYFDFLVNDDHNMTITGEFPDLVATLKSPNSKENADLFAYAKFFTAKNNEASAIDEKMRGRADSAKQALELKRQIGNELKKYDEDFMQKHQGTFVYDFLNLKNEKYAKDVPLAKNGRPDSVYQYYYYKSHYFDGVNFKDDRILLTPFFKDRVTKYFETVIVQHPDTVIQEVDKIFAKCTQGSDVYNSLLGYFAYKYENDKNMSFEPSGKINTFEKVFVHICDNYITNGKASGVYNDEVVEKIKKKADIMRNLLPDVKVPDLFMIDSTDGRRVLNMGFDTAKTNQGAAALYARHIAELRPLYKTLYGVNAKYTVLVFWSVDCGHCQKDIPQLNKVLKEIEGKIDYKVYAVQTHEEFFDRWKKFVAENHLNFINVFEPVHINNLAEKFDINRTPVIYILDRDKRIKAKNLSPEQVVDILKNLELRNI